MNREGKKCVLYPRVSTEMQVDGYSLEGQKNSLKRFADREEMEIVGIYEDAGKSRKSIEGRPAFKKMLSDIKNGLEIDYILVYKLSRFGRNAADILNSLEFVQSYRAEAERQIKEAGCRTRSDSVRVVETLVTATPEFFRGKKKSEIRAYFQEALTFIQQNQDPQNNHIRCGAYGRKNAPYAPFFCPADTGWQAQRQGDRGK